jgi:hypothetical protein
MKCNLRNLIIKKFYTFYLKKKITLRNAFKEEDNTKKCFIKTRPSNLIILVNNSIDKWSDKDE